MLSKINKQEGAIGGSAIGGIGALRGRAISGEIGFLFFFDLAHKAGEGGSARMGGRDAIRRIAQNGEGGDREWWKKEKKRETQCNQQQFNA